MASPSDVCPQNHHAHQKAFRPIVRDLVIVIYSMLKKE